MLDLNLCEDPETNIWSYYGTVEVNTHCITGLPNANSDCTFDRPIFAYEPLQGTQPTHVTSNSECACTI